MKIRPRIFLEGNWFVELQPGSPSAPTFSSGATIPITQTSNPVQLDQVLDALNSDTRANLQKFLVGYGYALTRKPTPPKTPNRTPKSAALNAAQALNKTYHARPASLRGGAIVGQATSGGAAERPLAAGRRDRQSERGAERPRTGLERTVGNFNTSSRAFAEPVHEPLPPRSRCCRARCRAIDRALTALGMTAASPRARSRSRSDPRRQADAIDDQRVAAVDRPGAGLARAERARRRCQGPRHGDAARSPSSSGRTAPLLQANRSVQQVPDESLLPGRRTRSCRTGRTPPASKSTKNSSPLDRPRGARPDLRRQRRDDALPGRRRRRHVPLGAGGDRRQLGERPALIARAPLGPEGTRPAFPAEEPPYKPMVPCYTQAVPNFNGPLSSGPADGAGG